MGVCMLMRPGVSMQVAVGVAVGVCGRFLGMAVPVQDHRKAEGQQGQQNQRAGGRTESHQERRHVVTLRSFDLRCN